MNKKIWRLLKLENNKKAKDSGDLSINIMNSICCSPEEIQQYAPDALMRVFVFLAKKLGWSLEDINENILKGAKYYYEND